MNEYALVIDLEIDLGGDRKDPSPYNKDNTLVAIGYTFRALDGRPIWRSDGAGDTQFEADKGAISDSLKRSAVAFGVGRHLYDLPDNMWVNCESKVVNGKAYFKKFLENPLDVLRRKRADFR